VKTSNQFGQFSKSDSLHRSKLLPYLNSVTIELHIVQSCWSSTQLSKIVPTFYGTRGRVSVSQPTNFIPSLLNNIQRFASYFLNIQTTLILRSTSTTPTCLPPFNLPD